MGVKREWKITEAHAGHGYFNQYNKEAGDGRKCVGAEFKVLLRVKLANDPTRDVFQTMTPDEADALADALREEAAKTRRMNETVGIAHKIAGNSFAPKPEKREPQTLGEVILNEIPPYETPGRDGVTVEQIAKRTGRSVLLVFEVIGKLTENGEIHGFRKPGWDALRYVKTENATF